MKLIESFSNDMLAVNVKEGWREYTPLSDTFSNVEPLRLSLYGSDGGLLVLVQGLKQLNKIMGSPNFECASTP